MRHRSAVLFAALLFASLVGAPALAHLTGVFAHFVDDINDPTASTRMLRQQLDSVGQRLAALEPEVVAARMAYDQEADAAVRRIRFYDIYAGSALGALWAGAQDPIDVIASTELLQRRLGDDLDWFWRTMFYETWTLDQAVASVDQQSEQVVVAIEDRGLSPMPARVRVTYDDGHTAEQVVPVAVWLGGERQATLTFDPGTVTRVEIDPEQFFPDVDRENNVWRNSDKDN